MDGLKSDSGPFFQLRRVGKTATLSGVRDELKLNYDVTKFGRHSGNTYYLNSAVLQNFISRWHAEIHRHLDGGVHRYLLKDNSLNGTYVNNTRAQGLLPLQEGDVVTFGHKNGKNIKPGQFAPQQESEFCFVFEKVGHKDHLPDCPPSPELAVDTSGTQGGGGQETPSNEPRELQPRKILGDGVLRDISNGSGPVDSDNPNSPRKLQDAMSDEDDVVNQAVNAANNFNNDDSDVDIFDFEQNEHQRTIPGTRPQPSLLSYLKIGSSAGVTQPPEGTTADNHYLSSAKSTPTVFISDEETPGGTSSKATTVTMATTTNSASNRTNVKSKASANQTNNKQTRGKSKGPTAQKKRRRTTTDSDDSDFVWHYDGDKCDADRCRRPKTKKVNWVQCDDCDKWYHTACADCSYDDVKDDDAEFHCGCV